jgi:hypothetical protein
MQTKSLLRARPLALAVAAGLLSSVAASAQTVAGANAPVAIQAPSTALLAQFPKMTGFQISPDGQHMLAIESQGDTRNIVVWKLSDLSARPNVIGARNMQIVGASFLKNDLLAVTLMQPFDLRTDTLTKTFINKLLFTDLEGKNWIEPMASADIARSDEAKLTQALARPSVLNRMPADPGSRGAGERLARRDARRVPLQRAHADFDAHPASGRGRRRGAGHAARPAPGQGAQWFRRQGRLHRHRHPHR